MSVHHFTPRELAELTDTVTSRKLDPTTPVRQPITEAHGRGNHWLVMNASVGKPTGRYCVFPGCVYSDRYVGEKS